MNFDGNGHTGGTPPATISDQDGNSITLPGAGTLVKAGNAFVGWNTLANGNGTNYAAGASYTIPASNSTLYAKWSVAITYTVTYNANGGTGAPVDGSSPYADGTSVTVLGTGGMSRTGYTFSNWNTAAGGGGTSYNPSNSFNISADVTLYAQWTISTYAVTYDGNTNTGGSTPGNQTKTYNVDLTLRTNSGGWVKTGNTFSGWNTAADGSGTDYAEGVTYSTNAALTLYAKWTPLTYSVTYDGNTNTGGAAPGSQTKTYGVNLTLRSNSGSLVKTGYTFSGWNTANDGSGTDYAESAAYSANVAVTLYAKWIINTYAITYNGNGSTGGSTPGNQTKTYNIDLALRSNSGNWVKTGFTFSGWNTATDGSGADYAESATYSTNAALNLYAKWTAVPTYSVTYNGNGNTGGATPGNQTKTQDIGLTLQSNSGNWVKTGYTFSGWNTAVNGSGTDYAEGETYSTNAALTLYAKWIINTYAVTYNGNGSTGGSTPGNQTKTYNVDLTLQANTGSWVKTGYIFSGWNTATDGSGANYAEGATYSTDAAMTLYAKWTIITYPVTYDGNTNTGGAAPGSQTKTYGVNLTLRSNSGALVKTGYIFSGWNTAANGTGTDYAESATYTTNSGLTLFAKWVAVPTYTVTYNGNGNTGGNAPGDQTKTEDVDLTLATNSGSLVKAGFAFVGWNTAADGSGTDYAESATYSTNAALTLYAKWLASYTIIFDGNGNTGGTAPGDQIKIQDIDLTLATNSGGLVKAGETFSGWNTKANGTGIDYAAGGTYTLNVGDTLYAKWVSVPSYTVTYNGNGNTGGAVPGDQTKVEDVNLTLATNSGGLVKTGATFSGWNTAANGGGTDYAESATYSANTALTLYAKWTPNTYSVTYDGNGNTGGAAPASQNKTHDVNLTLRTNSGSLVKSGFTFSGWNTAANGSGTNYAESATYSTNAVLTLYAKWTAVPTYSVTYNGNGNTGGSLPGNQTKTQDVDLTLRTNSGNLVKSGCSFSGWNTATDGSGADYAAGATYSANAALTLYAKWIVVPTYSVTYNGNGNTGGSAPASQTKVHDISLTLRANSGLLIKTGFSFAGWNTAADGTGTNYTESGSYTVNAAVTLYARWAFANIAPVITEGAGTNVTMDEDGAPTAFSLTLNATDANSDTITWSIQSQGSLGVAGASGTGLSKAINYTPLANQNGSDSFIVMISDGKGGTDTITVNVTIDPVNDSPVAVTDTYRVNKNAAYTLNAPGVLINDSDLELDSLTTIQVGGNPANAAAFTFNSDGSFSYTPTNGFVGTDTFSYKVNDGNSDSPSVIVTIRIVGPHGDYSCTQCHDAHGASSDFMPTGSAQTLMCESCHNPSGLASSTVDIGTHEHGGNASVTISCGGCHDVHSYMESTDTHSGSTTAANVKYIRSNPQKYVATALPELVYQTSNTHLAFTTSPYNGACQACHTTAGHGKNDGSDLGDNHVINNPDCTSCHLHKDSFKPPAGGGSCTSCHATPKGTSRRAVVAEFSMTTHHAADPADVADCEVCHDQSAHQVKKVRLKNVDTGAFLVELNTDSDPDSSATEAAKLTAFCLKCHDSGAQAGAGGSAPFSDGLTAPPINQNWAGSIHSSRSCYGDGVFGCHSNGHGSGNAKFKTNTLTEEDYCLNCHKSGGPGVDLKANYDAAVYWSTENSDLNDRHDIQPGPQGTSGAKLECADCHDVHGEKVAGVYPLRSDPDPTDGRNPANAGDYGVTDNNSDADFMTRWCLDCHDGSTPAGVTMTGGMTNMLSAYQSNDAHGGQTSTMTISLTGGWSPGHVVQCLDCHSAHMDTKRNLFHLRDKPLSSTGVGLDSTISGTGANYSYYESRDGRNTTNDVRGHDWCYTCHQVDSAMDGKAECVGAHAHGGSKF